MYKPSSDIEHLFEHINADQAKANLCPELTK